MTKLSRQKQATLVEAFFRHIKDAGIDQNPYYNIVAEWELWLDSRYPDGWECY